MAYEHGDPIRSADLEKRYRAAEANLATALLRSAAVGERVRMVELALHAARPASAPVGTATSSGGVDTVYLPLSPGPDAELVGPLVASRRSASVSAFSFTPESTDTGVDPRAWPSVGSVGGVGETVLLEEGAVWARLSPDAEAVFTARVEPAYLTYYNELVVPAIAGSVTVKLSRSTGSPRVFENVETSRIFRLPGDEEFTGVVTVESTSGSGFQGQYIHTLGGIQLRRSTWAKTGSATASLTAPGDGTLQISAVHLHPNGKASDFTVWKNGEAQAPGTIGVLEGDVLDLDVEVPWDAPASHVRVQYSLVTS
jgi:hypothetical protein